MCGILGAIGSIAKTVNETQFRAALAALNYRGPDATGIFQKENVWLGHQRLSIIDTSPDANQPMLAEHQRYALVFNGEIYNYLEIKQDLLQKGIVFRTESDTEVLLHGLITWGPELLKRLNGFFAFCFADLQTQTFILARDRFGIKPLSYSIQKNGLLFSSELKGLLPLLPHKAISKRAVAQYLQLSYIPSPLTIFEEVMQLAPGNYLLYNGETTEQHPFYAIPRSTLDIGYEEAKSSIRELVIKSVERRLLADVPIGTFLSGGVDSSIISWCAKQMKPDLRTFSLGFSGLALYDESKTAEETARFIGTKHTTFQLPTSALKEAIEAVVSHQNQPFADSSAIAVYLLSRETKKEITVALSGDGADELFTGYNKHEAFRRSLSGSLTNKIIKTSAPIWSQFSGGRTSKMGNRMRQLDKFSQGLKYTNLERYIEWASFTSSQNTSNIIGHNALQDLKDRLQDVRCMTDVLHNDFQLVLEGDMLRKVDRMSMRNSLEVRTPFLDHTLVDFVFQLPDEFKIDATSRKKILKDAFKADLPVGLFDRPKHGFEVPIAHWMKGILKPELDLLLSKDILEKQGLFSPDKTPLIYQQFLTSKSGEMADTIWALYVFQKWYSQYFNLQC